MVSLPIFIGFNEAAKVGKLEVCFGMVGGALREGGFATSIL